MSAEAQLAAIAAKVKPMVERHARLFINEVWPGLAKANVEILRWRDLDEAQCKELNEIFLHSVLPVCTPLAVGPAHLIFSGPKW